MRRTLKFNIVNLRLLLVIPLFLFQKQVFAGATCAQLVKEIAMAESKDLEGQLFINAKHKNIKWLGTPMPKKAIEFYQGAAMGFFKTDVMTTDSLEVVDISVRPFLRVEKEIERASVSDAIELNLKFEKMLVDLALENKPHEVGAVRAFLSNGEVITGDIIEGGRFEMPSKPQTDIRRLIKTFKDELLPGVSIVEVIYSHVHPMYEFLNRTQGNVTAIPLSFSDHVGISEARVKGDFLLTMQAILPNGYTYRQTFLKGDSFSRSRYWKQRGLELHQDLTTKIESNFKKGEVAGIPHAKRTTSSLLAEYFDLLATGQNENIFKIKEELINQRNIDEEKL